MTSPQARLRLHRNHQVEMPPLQLLELMRWEDLEQRLCGGTIDIDVLRQHTTYGGTAICARVMPWCVSRPVCAHSQAA